MNQNRSQCLATDCVRLIAILAFFALTSIGSIAAAARTSSTIDLTVVDEGGRTLPFVTVWHAVTPCPDLTIATGRRSISRGFGDCLDAEDLLRLARRLSDRFEFFVSNYALRPSQAVLQLPMIGATGRLFVGNAGRTVLGSLGDGKVSKVRMSFVFLKRNFDPAALDVELTGESPSFKGTVVLRRRGAAAQSREDLWAEFEQLRYRLAGVFQLELLRASSQADVDEVRRLLRSLLDRALNAQEPKLAAAVMTTLRFAPVMHYGDTGRQSKVVGFDKTGDAREAHLLEEASGLDPENPFFVSIVDPTRPAAKTPYFEALPKESELGPWSDWIESREAQLLSLEPHLWPRDYLLFGSILSRFGYLERSYLWLDRFRQQHPKLPEVANSFHDLRQIMRRYKQPIPAHWTFAD